MAVRQTSFAAGELDRLVQGRTDLELFRHGARKLLNFVVNQQGSAVTRPGFGYAWEAKDADVRLVPFVLEGASVSRVLEFGNLYVRIYNPVTCVQAAAELVTPFTTADLSKLRWAQAGNVLTVTCEGREPQELTIEAATATIFPVRYGPPGDAPGDAPMEAAFPDVLGNKMPVLSEWQPTTMFVLDAAHPPREWRYKVSMLMRHNVTGQVIETLPRDITQYDTGGNVSTVPYVPGVIANLPADNLLILFSDAPIYIYPGAGAVVADPANWTPIEYVFYRGRGRLFGLIGSSDSNNFFGDFGDEPDYLTPPLRGESPFEAGEYPVAVAYFQQRRAFALENRWFASAVAEFANFDEPVLNWHGQPLEATLVGEKRENIVAMVQLEHLFVLTDSSIWVVGRNDVPLDYDTFPSVCRPVDKVGSLPIMPLMINGNVLVYPRSEGRGIRALEQTQGGYAGSDISWHAQHLFRGRYSEIRSWCFQRDPWGVAWVVREDGTLLSLTRGGDGSWAWAKQQTDTRSTITDLGDKFLSVACVPSTFVNDDAQSLPCDVVFAATRRRHGVASLTTVVERMYPPTSENPPRQITDPLFTGNRIGDTQMGYQLDSYVVAVVDKTTGAVAFVGQDLAHLEGRYVWGSCPGIEPYGPLLVTGGTVTIPPGSWAPTFPYGGSTFKAAFGLNYTCDLALLDAAPGTLNQKNVVSVGFEVDNAVGLKTGEDFDHLVEYQNRRVTDAYGYPQDESTLVKVGVKGSWNLQGRAVLRQEKPLPVTVLGVTRDLAPGGK